jgi:hypothetical protein
MTITRRSDMSPKDMMTDIMIMAETIDIKIVMKIAIARIVTGRIATERIITERRDTTEKRLPLEVRVTEKSPPPEVRVTRESLSLL